MDRIKVEIKIIKGEKLFSKSCPFGVNNEVELTKPSQMPIIRAVGSPLCRRCASFITIQNDEVWCK